MIGSLIGSVLGYKFGGFFGLIIGGILGAQAETWISENLLGKPSRKAQVQSSYFEALFVTMGKLAKADGVISKNEIRKCEAIMNHMQLDAERRKQAINLFNLGKQDNLELDLYLNKFIKATHQQKKKTRLWATPENEELWKKLLEMEIDLINTDKLSKLRDFLLEKS